MKPHPVKPKPKPNSPVRAQATRPGAVRIIGGQWRRTPLAVLSAPGLRPTPDRVRETLFNWLGQDLTGWRCVDAFAGTGALGFEAASRGAIDVLMLEPQPDLNSLLQKNKQKLSAEAIRIQRGDGIAALQRLPAGGCDLVFLDPPFDSPHYAAALAAAARAVAPGRWVYLEAARAWTPDEVAAHGLALHRHLKAGQVHAHLLQKPLADAA